MTTKFTLLFLVIISMTFARSYSQGVPTFPIPSHNNPVDSVANFIESCQTSQIESTQGRRNLNATIKPKTSGGICSATLWVYSLDQTTMLGPYDLDCGETLSVEIDEREWGVMVESEDEVLVDVWIE